MDLADRFGAPLYVLDEDRVRANCRTYVRALADYMPAGSYPLFAGKALCFKGLYPVLDAEGMGADVVSPGEIYTALAGGFPPERLYFHGNNKTDEDIRKAFDAGASMVTAGSIAVTEPETFLRWMETYGAERMILGADVRDGYISINGWQEESRQRLPDFLARYMKAGTRHVLCTEISRDGMLQGPAIALYREVMEAHPECHLIASGGVSGIQDIRDLQEAGIPAVVFGKAIYEGRIDMEEMAKEFIVQRS